MSIHSLSDRLAVAMGRMYGSKMQFFGADTQSCPIQTCIQNTKVSVDKIDKEGEYEAQITSCCGHIQSFFKVIRWAGKHYPSLLFIHGSGDFPYYQRACELFATNKITSPFNLIALSIPFNTSPKDYIRAIADVRNYILILSATAHIAHELMEHLKNRGSMRVVLSGISLGGWITNLHCAVWNSADAYVPIMAGARSGDVFFHTIYHKLVSPKALRERERIEADLNFERLFLSRDRKNVYPLLAEYDQFIPYNTHSNIYLPENITRVPKGHITCSLDRSVIRNHLMQTIFQKVPATFHL